MGVTISVWPILKSPRGWFSLVPLGPSRVLINDLMALSGGVGGVDGLCVSVCVYVAFFFYVLYITSVHFSVSVSVLHFSVSVSVLYLS